MQTAPKHRSSALEYLALERNAETKSEFLDGELFAMAGGSRRHSRIAVNIAGVLNRRLAAGACQVFNSDMRLKITATGLYTYPDVQVACDNLRFEDEREDVLLNPKLIVEVLSDSSAAWDRGKKFWHYRHLESLSDYLLIAQDSWLAEHYTCQNDGSWRLETVEGQRGMLRVKSINVELPLKEIYAKTGLKPGLSAPSRNSPSSRKTPVNIRKI